MVSLVLLVGLYFVDSVHHNIMAPRNKRLLESGTGPKNGLFKSLSRFILGPKPRDVLISATRGGLAGFKSGFDRPSRGSDITTGLLGALEGAGTVIQEDERRRLEKIRQQAQSEEEFTKRAGKVAALGAAGFDIGEKEAADIFAGKPPSPLKFVGKRETPADKLRREIAQDKKGELARKRIENQLEAVRRQRERVERRKEKLRKERKTGSAAFIQAEKESDRLFKEEARLEELSVEVEIDPRTSLGGFLERRGIIKKREILKKVPKRTGQTGTVIQGAVPKFNQTEFR